MNIKKLSALAMVVALAAALAACGGKSDSGASSSAPAASSNGGVVEVKLAASNFEFDQKEVHVKKGDKVKLTLENAQGMHGVSIPEFNVDLNKAGSVEFTADKAGEFEFNCSVMCGAGHADMKGKLIVE